MNSPHLVRFNESQQLTADRFRNVAAVLEQAMDDVKKGLMEPSKGHAISALASSLVKVLVASDAHDKDIKSNYRSPSELELDALMRR